MTSVKNFMHIINTAWPDYKNMYNRQGYAYMCLSVFNTNSSLDYFGFKEFLYQEILPIEYSTLSTCLIFDHDVLMNHQNLAAYLFWDTLIEHYNTDQEFLVKEEVICIMKARFPELFNS